ncbi:hypothetical protein MLD38_040415 [Melastoma candidum]|uniref:Uncharacterized protein n=1 Tax=Melastoma candidum TaxID=119954 RepID=A0ACB9L5L8_9MYRT|nr:hypothetical protein MLD38_040415 [Melastoma candidum]
MLAGLLLSLTGALSKLRRLESVESSSSACIGRRCCRDLVVLGIEIRKVVAVVVVPCLMILRFPLQRSNLGSSAASMTLRPKRTCSGLVCSGGFHTQRFVALFLFLRGDLTGYHFLRSVAFFLSLHSIY